MSQEIRSYWEQRANKEAQSGTATTNDVYLRELEIATTVEQLRRFGHASGRLLDVGCGDGYSTLAVARALPELKVVGVDYSENMIAAAGEHLAKENLGGRVSFAVGDATDLGASLGAQPAFDAALSMRCLINLGEAAKQELAFGQVAARLRDGGHYLAIENFHEGQEEMNRARASVGLPEIAVRWHNLFFREADFLKWASPHFDAIELVNFASAYYFATRVVYSKMCQMRNEQPDYRHEIHQLAVHLPSVGNFCPIRMAIMRRRG